MKKFISILILAMVVLGANQAFAQGSRVESVFFYGANNTSISTSATVTNAVQLFVAPGNGYAKVTSFRYTADNASEPFVSVFAYPGLQQDAVTAAALAAATNINVANTLFASAAGITTNDYVIIPDTTGYLLRKVTSASATNIGLAAIGRALTTSDYIYQVGDRQVVPVTLSANGTNQISFANELYLPRDAPSCIEFIGAANGLNCKGSVSGYRFNP